MRRWVRDRRNAAAAASAKKKAERTGGIVCATVAPSGKPVYFVEAADATPEAVALRAFELRNGRTPTPDDARFISMLLARQG